MGLDASLGHSKQANRASGIVALAARLTRNGNGNPVTKRWASGVVFTNRLPLQCERTVVLSTIKWPRNEIAWECGPTLMVRGMPGGGIPSPQISRCYLEKMWQKFTILYTSKQDQSHLHCAPQSTTEVAFRKQESLAKDIKSVSRQWEVKQRSLICLHSQVKPGILSEALRL